MIHGVGTDIVSIARFEKMLDQYGERVARRILADAEWEGFRQHLHPARFLAKRFAAKEAAVKALGTGFRDGISMRHIVISHDALGRPLLQCSGKMYEMMKQLAVGESFISISDERDYAVAFVTLLRSDGLTAKK